MAPVRRAAAPVAPQKALPAKTPIAQLGLTAAEARGLTPGARKLTKGDLVALMKGQVPKAAQALTVRDLTSINAVYSKALAAAARPPGPGCCCCCSTPCCCCCSAAAA